jgi:outer membrane protein assembly factor BamB
MTAADASEKPLRLRAGVVLLGLQWLAFFLPFVVPSVGFFGMLGALAAALAIVAWWLFFSRAPWRERVLAIALMPLAAIAARPFVHPTIQHGGMGRMMYILGAPFLCLGLVAWSAASRRLSTAARLVSLPAALLLGAALLGLLRTGGISGEGRPDLHWRWTPTPEERLLARGSETLAPLPAPKAAPPSPLAAEPTMLAAESPTGLAAQKAALAPEPATTTAKARPQPAASAPPVSAAVSPPTSRGAGSSSPASAAAAAGWPGFRGAARDGVVRGVRIAADWSASPPVELWRRAIGPGWSSFAVKDGLVYTQEQRGEEEQVACYRLDSGQPVWRHGDPTRHWDSEGGVGPRATPAIRDDRVYAFGGTGRLNALDAASGAVVWSRDAAADASVETPGWGFAGSPLVVGDVVIVAASGRLAAYDLASGERRWLGPEGGGGYSSPQLATIDGVPQVLLLRGARSTSVAPANGALLWEHRAQPGVSIVQPALTAEGDVLVASGDAMGGNGIRRLAVVHGPGGWSAEERWMSTGLKPYFNDFVVHKGYAFGFDGGILACIDLADGQRKWKGGRYGHGQLVLLADQDLLLVLSEDGELVLVKATPDAFSEVAKAPALHGKSWSHPVLVGDVVLVRNGEEMAAFRLARAGS